MKIDLGFLRPDRRGACKAGRGREGRSRVKGAKRGTDGRAPSVFPSRPERTLDRGPGALPLPRRSDPRAGKEACRSQKGEKKKGGREAVLLLSFSVFF